MMDVWIKAMKLIPGETLVAGEAGLWALYLEEAPKDKIKIAYRGVVFTIAKNKVIKTEAYPSE